VKKPLIVALALMMLLGLALAPLPANTAWNSPVDGPPGWSQVDGPPGWSHENPGQGGTDNPGPGPGG
jgi:hypothetical protein